MTIHHPDFRVRAYIRSIRLFGPMTCRIGGCGGDGTHEVYMVGYDSDNIPLAWTGPHWRCAKHAAEDVQWCRSRAGRRKAKA